MVVVQRGEKSHQHDGKKSCKAWVEYQVEQADLCWNTHKQNTILINIMSTYFRKQTRTHLTAQLQAMGFYGAYTRGVQKFCNSIWCTNDTSKIFTLLFNIITLNSNAYVTFIKQLFDASQLEFLLHALQVRLRGLLDLVIIFEPCSCSVGCTQSLRKKLFQHLYSI